MESMIRFSLFGNYEKFSTNNLEYYLKLIDFFGKKGYKPSTTNELQLQPNAQPRVLIMPVFLNESNAIVEITSGRINFQKNSDNIITIETLKEDFENEFSDLLNIFVSDMSILSNRVALNCDIFEADISAEMPTPSKYFDDENKTEMSVRNVARKEVENEETNIILEKYVAKQGGFTKYSYDINSIGENQVIRFNNNNIKKMYEAYISIAIEIEKGLK